MAGGQATPPTLLEPFAKNAVACSPAAPVAGGKTYPFPQPSQVDVVNGAASLDDGFTPLNMTNPAAGGVPPFGVDMNGILFYLSSHIAAMAAGQLYQYNATLSAFMGGYAIGAVLQQSANPNAFWINQVAANETDPDTGGAGWLSTVPLYSAAALAGPNDVVLPGVSDYVISVNTAGGAVPFSGFVAQRDGQRITLIANGANLLKLLALQGSAAANQIQASSETDVLGNDSITLAYSKGFGKWLVV